MPLQVIEGTWEEIERRKSELIGRHLTVTIQPESPKVSKPSDKKEPAVQAKKLSGFGAFKGKVGSSDEFAREKRVEIEREERDL